MCKLIENEITEIRKGNNQPLGRLYSENYQDLIKGLRGKTRSQRSIEDMEDALQEAFFVVRRNIQRPTFRNENICGFIVNVAYNKLLDSGKKMKRMTGFEVDEIERYISSRQGIHEEDFSPAFSNLDDQQKRQVDHILLVWESFGEACKRLLRMLWMQERKLKNIWEELEYKNYETAKSAKSRCVKKLKEKVAISISS